MSGNDDNDDNDDNDYNDDNDDNDGDMSPSSEREELSPDLQSASDGGRHTRFAPRLIAHGL